MFDNTRPTVIFTSFWDANWLLGQGIFIEYVDDKLVLFKRHQIQTYSIALYHPSLTKLKNIDKIGDLPYLAPSRELLTRYKNGQNWREYTKEYSQILKKASKPFRSFLESLPLGEVALLCCWEDTTSGSHCHRRIVYERCMRSKTAKSIASYVYRHGTSMRGAEVLYSRATCKAPYVGDAEVNRNDPVYDNYQCKIGEIVGVERNEALKYMTLIVGMSGKTNSGQ